MSGIATATVETLTAEVRVLMVGSRQITQSVAKQLDECNFGELVPMGRVRVEKERQHVIGKHAQTGELRLSRYPAFCLGVETHTVDYWDMPKDGRVAATRCYFDEERDFDEWVASRWPGLRLDKKIVEMSCAPYGERYREHVNNHMQELRCQRGRAVTPEMSVRLANFSAVWLTQRAQMKVDREKADALPLIVLAGLR